MSVAESTHGGAPSLLDEELRLAFPPEAAIEADADLKLRYLRELHSHYIEFFTPPEATGGLGPWETPSRIAAIESAWNRHEEARAFAVESVLPRTLAEFDDWFFTVAAEHEYHDVCSYLRHSASLLDIALFMLAEEKVDGRFDDIIALSQIGASGVTKMTIANNFWDEMGNGDYSFVHTDMFDHSAGWMRDNVVAKHDIDLAILEFAEVYSNACEMLAYALRRQYLLRSLASIGLLEQTAPARFSATVDGSRRVGVPDHVVRYQEVHVGVDQEHGREWFNGVFKPIIESNPDTVSEISLGVLIRGNVASEFYRKVKDTLFGLG